MEKLKKNVILSLIIAAIALTIFAKAVFASGTVAMQTIPTSSNNAVVLSSNIAKDNQTNATPISPNVVPTTNVVTNTTTVPQTGEYDTYIIAGIAIVVTAIGAFSFINAKRYSK